MKILNDKKALKLFITFLFFQISLACTNYSKEIQSKNKSFSNQDSIYSLEAPTNKLQTNTKKNPKIKELISPKKSNIKIYEKARIQVTQDASIYLESIVVGGIIVSDSIRIREAYGSHTARFEISYVQIVENSKDSFAYRLTEYLYYEYNEKTGVLKYYGEPGKIISSQKVKLPIDYSKDKKDQMGLFPVYELQEGTYGVSIHYKKDINFDKYELIKKFESKENKVLYRQKNKMGKNYSYNYYKKYRLPKRKENLDVFYVYYEDGTTEKATVKNILTLGDVCASVGIILELDIPKGKKSPLFASKEKIQLTYDYSSKISNIYKKIATIQGNGCSQKKMTNQAKIFARFNDYYLGYQNEDNYNDETYIAPTRHIFKVDNDKVKIKFFSFYDLYYECPC